MNNYNNYNNNDDNSYSKSLPIQWGTEQLNPVSKYGSKVVLMSLQATDSLVGEWTSMHVLAVYNIYRSVIKYLALFHDYRISTTSTSRQ